jgi:endoglucanase Acf2
MVPLRPSSTFALSGLAAGILCLGTLSAFAQEAVPVGKGSYAATPPPNVAAKAQKAEGRKLFMVKEDGRPIPSHKWYMSLLVKPFGVGLWTYPMRLDTSASGLQVYYPTKWRPDGKELVCDMPLMIGGQGFAAADSRLKDWSDWTASFRLGQTADKYIDVTAGEGMPYVWAEYHGVQPTIAFGAGAGKNIAPTGSATFFGAGGNPATLPVTGDTLGIEYAGRSYAVFAPAGSKFEGTATGLNVTFGGGKSFLVVCALPAAKDIDFFRQYAFAIPRSTVYSWKYDPAAGVLATNWKVVAEPLQGKNTQVIQGWIPHQYRTNVAPVSYAAPAYTSVRGAMRTTVGNDFTFAYRYNGIVPNLPAPKVGVTGYDPAKLTGLINKFAGKPDVGGDTYGGGKNLVKCAQFAFMAQQLGDPSYEKILGAVRDALINWYTYSAGEKDHFFAYYPRSKALVGFSPAYGSESFTDVHFHHAYFIFATAMVAAQDPAFAKDYGAMATLAAKQYANWDRADQRFPFLRTFDIWQGHSWASASANDAGLNNQESSSEAMQCWAGLILLGQALGDANMLSTGVMGYVSESNATLEYWFNTYGDIFPKEYPNPLVSVVYSAGNGWHTWFTGDYTWFYGIQWIPTSPMLSFFVRDPASAKRNWDNFVRIRSAQKGATPPLEKKTFGGDLVSYLIGYVMMYDPKWAVEQVNNVLVESPGNTWLANVYYEAASMLTIGHADFTSYTDCPTSMVYLNDATKVRTFLVWNPQTKPLNVNAYVGGKLAGKIVAAPGGLTTVTGPAK